jgi:hypothetical protein
MRPTLPSFRSKPGRSATAKQSRCPEQALKTIQVVSEIKNDREFGSQEAELKRLVAKVERLEDRLPSILNRLSASAACWKAD